MSINHTIIVGERAYRVGSAGTNPGFYLAHIKPCDAKRLGAKGKHDFAIRVDGERAELVRIVNGYTATVRALALTATANPMVLVATPAVR